jgi:NTE family protein
VWERLMSFWKDNTAQSWVEITFNQFVVNYIRLINSGFIPTLQLSPSSPLIQTTIGVATMAHRQNFRSFDTLLRTHIDFDEIRSWGPRTKRPVLIIGAANVTTGKLTKFISIREPISVEHILASCAVPNLFPAVHIEGDAYWDGLFSDNPPVQELIKPTSVGMANIPEEIWLIKINPTTSHSLPVRPDDILDRRNQLEGNISLFQQLRHLEMFNDMLLQSAFRPEFLSNLDITAPVRIPKSFHSDDDKPYHIPCIEMPLELQHTLDYESKLDRGAANIDYLIAQGEKSARTFLTERAANVARQLPQRQHS